LSPDTYKTHEEASQMPTEALFTLLGNLPTRPVSDGVQCIWRVPNIPVVPVGCAARVRDRGRGRIRP